MVSAYHIETISKCHAKVTSKYEKSRFIHIINLINTPPTCSFGCLRLLGFPCTEMCVYAKSIKLPISRILPYKFTLHHCHEILEHSLPADITTCVIDRSSLSLCHNPVILPPHVMKNRGRPVVRRFKTGQLKKTRLSVASVVYKDTTRLPAIMQQMVLAMKLLVLLNRSF